MKNQMKNLFGGDRLAVSLILFVSVLIFSPVFWRGIPYGTQDFVHHLQISNAIYESLINGVWIPSWIFTENGGYGAVTVRLYPPMMHYSLAIFRILLGDWQWALFAGFVFWSFVGGLGVYVWTGEFFARRWQATAAALLFVLAPYHLNQFYNSFMYGEFAALSVLPFAFYFALKVCRRGALTDVLGLAVAFSLIVLSNLPQTVVAAIAVGAYILLNADRKKLFNQFGKLAAAGGLAAAASAFFWVRLIGEINWINISLPNTNPAYDFRNHFMLDNFAFDIAGIWFASMIFGLSIFLTATALLFAGEAKAAFQNRDIRNVSILSVGAILMMLPVSRFAWEHLHFLQKIQFPWRFLSILTVGACVLTTFALGVVNSENWRSKRPAVLLTVGTALIFLTFSVKQVALGALFMEPQHFAALTNFVAGETGLWHWQPVWSNEKTFVETAPVNAGGRAGTVNVWEAERRAFSVKAGAGAPARVALLYYPHWRASVNGKPAEIYPSDDGAVWLDLPPESSDVILEFVEPAANLWARKISAVAWSVVLLLLLYGIRSKHKTSEPALNA